MFMLIVQQTANTVYGPNKKTKGRATDFKIYLLGVARMDRNRSEYISGTAQVEQLEDKAEETKLRWVLWTSAQEG